MFQGGNVSSSTHNNIDTIDRSEFLGRLFVSHQGWLSAWLRKKTGCPHHAADLVQEAFIRVLTLADPMQLQQPRAFLTTTATRLLIDEARRRKLEQAYLEALANMADAYEDVAHTPEQILLAVEALNAIATMLEGLAVKPRRAFLMSRLDGAGHAEIAAELGVSVSMVKQYVATAIGHCYRVLYPIPHNAGAAG
jgi:RNA polymerase sigma factor (sigma-70 family)